MTDDLFLEQLKEKLKKMNLFDLRQVAREVGVNQPTTGKKQRLIDCVLAIADGKLEPCEKSAYGAPVLNKNYDVQLVNAIKQHRAENINLNMSDLPEFKVCDSNPVNEEFTVKGILDSVEGKWLLCTDYNITDGNCVFVSEAFVNKYRLKKGDLIEGSAKRKSPTEIAGLTLINYCNGLSPIEGRERQDFGSYLPVYPDKKFNLSANGNIAGRVMDLVCPMGAGQRTLVASPVGADRIRLLKDIAKAVSEGEQNAEVVFLLIDAHPEDCTELKRSLNGVTVLGSTFEKGFASHIRTANLAMERAMRIAESGKDAVLIIDGFNYFALSNSGTSAKFSAGIDDFAINSVKKYVACAKNTDSGASLTIIASLTLGGAINDNIYNCLKDVFASQINLSADLTLNHVYPPIDVSASGTVGNEKFLTEGEIEASDKLRDIYKSCGAKAFLSYFKESADNLQLINKLKD